MHFFKIIELNMEIPGVKKRKVYENVDINRAEYKIITKKKLN